MRAKACWSPRPCSRVRPTTGLTPSNRRVWPQYRHTRDYCWGSTSVWHFLNPKGSDEWPLIIWVHSDWISEELKQRWIPLVAYPKGPNHARTAWWLGVARQRVFRASLWGHWITQVIWLS
jgi:hypothetical protein